VKFLAIHDGRGNISRLVAYPPDSPPGAVAVEPGQLMTEVDAAEVSLDFANPESYQRLAEMLTHFQVEGNETEGKLVRKGTRPRESS
jgi:cytochrome c1